MNDMLVHGTAVKINDRGVLLRGKSGSGKSDLALILVDRGGTLISDDQVLLAETDGTLVMEPPTSLAGLLEVRGLGIVQVPYEASMHLDLIVDLRPRTDIERLPEKQFEEYHGIKIPKITLHAFEQSTPIKIELMLAKKNTVLDIDVLP